MRIAIFEMEHFEVAYPLIRLFDFPGNQLTIFTSEACFHRFRELFGDSIDKYDFIIQKQESKIAFIYKAYKAIRQQEKELLIFSTISDNFIFYYLMISQLKSIRVLVTLHDVNTFFRHKFTFSLRRLVRIAGKKMLMNGVKEFIVIALPMVGELQKKIPAFKKVHCIPGSVYEPGRFLKMSSQKRPRLQLVIPGSIDGKRRNYHIVFKLIEKIMANPLPVHIIFLGTAYGDYGDEIIKLAEKYTAIGQSLSFYKSPVDQKEYDKCLNESDVIFIPSVLETVIADDITETYGITKSSGTVYDVVRHAKPFIIPKPLAIDSFLEPAALRYDSVAEIFNFLNQMIADPVYYESMHDKALNASENYTIEKVRLRNPDLFP